MTDVPAAGSVVEAVEKQLDELGVQGVRPGLSAVAVVLAQGLDNPKAVPQHAALARSLVDVLGRLAKSERPRGRLSAVRSMTDGA